MTETQMGFDVEARAQVLDRVLQHTDDPWRESAMRALADLAATGAAFQATDITRMGVGEPAHPNHWGALLRAASQVGLIEPVGYAPSNRPTAQGSTVRTWRGKDARPTADRIVELRALSIHRPYAALILAGLKPVENRTWSTRYRGLLIVHAAKSRDWLPPEQLDLLTTPAQATIGLLPDLQPTGFVGVVELVDICSAGVDYDDCSCGPWALRGSYHWRLANPTPFRITVKANGRQGLFIPPLIVEDIARRTHNHPEAVSA